MPTVPRISIASVTIKVGFYPAAIIKFDEGKVVSDTQSREARRFDITHQQHPGQHQIPQGRVIPAH